MRKILFLPLVAAMLSVILNGCGSPSMSPSTPTPAANSAPVSITMTDDPPAGVTVLFFQVSLTDASLMPASGTAVSLLNNNTPIQIDVTQLQALSAFLSTANVAAGTYNSLSLTFANPQIVIFNASDQSIASTCAVGTVCTLTPTIDNSATLSLTTAPFPLTVAANMPLGLLVDFRLNTIIQPDLTVNLGVANGVTVSQLTATPPSHHPPFGALTVIVQSVNAAQTQFTVLTPWGRTFTINTDSNTTFTSFPMSACATAGFSCVAVGESVSVQVASVVSAGTLLASGVSFLEAPGQQTVEGTIVGITPATTTPVSPTVIKLILHKNNSINTGLPMGGEALVTIASGATFAIDATGVTIPSGLTFADATGLGVGQTVQVDVVAGSLTDAGVTAMHNGWGPPHKISFSADTVQLEPGQITGVVGTIDSTTTSFALNNFPGFFFSPMATATPKATVDTTAQTTFDNFTTDDFTGLATGELVSVNGWLFPAPSSTTTSPPTVVAQKVTMHQNHWF